MPALPTPAKVRALVAAVRETAGRPVQAVRLLPGGGIEVTLGDTEVTVSPADLVRMDD